MQLRSVDSPIVKYSVGYRGSCGFSHCSLVPSLGVGSPDAGSRVQDVERLGHVVDEDPVTVVVQAHGAVVIYVSGPWRHSYGADTPRLGGWVQDENVPDDILTSPGCRRKENSTLQRFCYILFRQKVCGKITLTLSLKLTF